MSLKCKKTKYLYLILIIVIILIISFLFFLKINPSSSTINIGVTIPLSGPQVYAGQEIKEGLDLGIEEINLSNSKIKYNLIYEDTICDPKNASSSTQKLIDIDNIHYLFGDFCSSGILASAPITERSKVIHIPFGASPDVEFAGEYVFRNKPNTRLETRELSRFLYNNEIKTVSALLINSDYGKGTIKAFEEEFDKLGGRIIKIEYYDTTAKDIKSQLQKIKASNPDVIYLAPYPSDLANIMKQIKELGISKPIFSCTGTEIGSFKNLADMEGTIYPYIEFNKTSKEYIDFEKKFISKYNKNPSFQSAVAYDAVTILNQAINMCEDILDTNCVKDKLLNTKFDVVSGEVKFNENGELISTNYVWKTYHNGDFIYLKDYNPNNYKIE
ncbi:MAG: penicillin-binding protein activator [archaeon]